jgi:diguanylate cyclase (GGDEF)-like protein
LRREVERLFDLDDFKKVNDGQGHAAGDELLRAISATIMASIRKTDMACRYGGDDRPSALPSQARRQGPHRARMMPGTKGAP